MSTHGSVKSIAYALLANLGIAITKTFAAIYTGSGAMLAEAVHSYADCGNQCLLFLGLRSSKQKPSREFPLGHGKAIFFWSFVVALILFSMGGLFSIYEGVHKLHLLEPIKSPIVAILVLSSSIVLEGFSLWGCLTQINKIRRDKSLWNWVKNTRQSELVIVLGEDIAALFGLAFALICILLAVLTQNPFFDAIGSIGIGVLLIIISILLAIKVKGLLIGQSAEKEVEDEIISIIENTIGIEKVLHLITIQLGSQIMVALKAKMTENIGFSETIANINKCEEELKKQIPAIQWVFFEPDNED